MTGNDHEVGSVLPWADDEEAELWRALQDRNSPSARDELFMRHKGFAVGIAKRKYLERKGSDIELQDLCQWAFAGLLESIDRFDFDHGAPFRSFAARRVTGSILDGLAKSSETREQASFRNRLNRERIRSLAPDQESLRDLSLNDAMKRLAEIAVGLAVGFMIEGTGVYLSDESDPRVNAYESLAWKELVDRAVVEMDSLPEREKLIIRRHYRDGLTFDQIGELLGLSKGRISQLHRAALAVLKDRLLAGGFQLGP